MHKAFMLTHARAREHAATYRCGAVRPWSGRCRHQLAPNHKGRLVRGEANKGVDEFSRSSKPANRYLQRSNSAKESSISTRAKRRRLAVAS